jgi:cellobiose phosphorylase
LSISQSILGIKPSLDGLVIDPCIPAEWKEFTVNRFYRGAYYDILVKNPQGVEHGVKAIYTNGTRLSGQLLPLAPEGTHVHVQVIMG